LPYHRSLWHRRELRKARKSIDYGYIKAAPMEASIAEAAAAVD